jgi:hypothetical protein
MPDVSPRAGIVVCVRWPFALGEEAITLEVAGERVDP